MVRHEFPRLTLCYIPRRTTSFNQPLDRAYFRAIKANISRQFCSDLAKEVLDSSNPIGQLVRRPTLRVHAPGLVTSAVTASHTKERLQEAWKHLLLQEGETAASLVVEAEAERVAGRLFGDVVEEEPEEQEDWMAEVEEAPAMGEDVLVDWVPEEQASDLALPWQGDEVPPMEAVHPETAPVQVPASHVRLSHMSRWLALRLAYGTASKKELAMAVNMLPAAAPSPPAAQCQHGGSSGSGLKR